MTLITPRSQSKSVFWPPRGRHTHWTLLSWQPVSVTTSSTFSNKRPSADATSKTLCLPVGIQLDRGHGIDTGSGTLWKMLLVRSAACDGRHKNHSIHQLFTKDFHSLRSDFTKLSQLGELSIPLDWLSRSCCFCLLLRSHFIIYCARCLIECLNSFVVT